VQDLADVVEDPQVQANGFFTTVNHPTHGPYQTIGLPLKFSESDVQVRGPAPEVGQHTEEVLIEAGYSWEDIAGLRDSGLFG
jgi:CoA:oxalate CoA-transferase